MEHDGLGIGDRALLIALMTAAEDDIPTGAFKERFGIELRSDRRRRLVDRKLLESVRSGRGFVHSLTEDGWRWCAEEFSAPRPDRAGSAGGALYAVLAGVGRYLDRTNQQLADVFQPVRRSVSDQIRAAYAGAPKEDGWATLTDIRAALPAVPREDVDAALIELNREPDVRLSPDSNRKALSTEQRAAAVRFGGEDRHLVWIESR